jgi:hypothetical protein
MTILLDGGIVAIGYNVMHCSEDCDDDNDTKLVLDHPILVDEKTKEPSRVVFGCIGDGGGYNFKEQPIVMDYNTESYIYLSQHRQSYEDSDDDSCGDYNDADA